MTSPNSASTASSDPSASSARYLVLVGALIVQLILGTVYGYSIFWEPLSERIFPGVITAEQKAAKAAAGEDVSMYLVAEDATSAKRQREIQLGYLKYSFSICILTFAAVMVIAGRVQDLKGPRFPAIIGAVLMGTGFVSAGLINSPVVFYMAHAIFTGLVCLILLMLFHAWFSHLSQEEHVKLQYAPMAIVAAVLTCSILLGMEYAGKLRVGDKLLLLWGTIGFLAGAGIGFAYVCPIAALVKWFPKQKGLVSGIAVAGFGFGAYLFSREFGALGYIRTHGITTFFLVHGLVCLVAIIAGAMLLRNPPQLAAKAAAAAAPESTWQQTLKRPSFYVLWAMFFIGAMSGLMVIGIVKPFVTEQLANAKLDAKAAAAAGAAAVGYLAIFNALGRVFWGTVSDRIGRTLTFVFMFGIQAVVMFVLGRLDTTLALYVGAAAVGFNFGGNFALFPSATADLFGAKNLGANYGWVFTSYGIAGVVGIAAGNAAKVQTGSYAAAFTLSAGLCVLSMILALVLRKMPRPATA